MSHWPAGVTVVGFRDDDGRVIATTVSAFTSLSVEPPLVLLALGPNATVRPFLTAGTQFGISILGGAQRRLATVFADSFPVGPDPFSPTGAPVIVEAPVTLGCTVVEVHPGGTHAIVIAAVDDAHIRGGDDPLIRFKRRYARLD